MAAGRASSEGRRSFEKASEDSRGNRVGRWSIETTEMGGPVVMLQEKGTRKSQIVCVTSFFSTKQVNVPFNVNGGLVKGGVDGVDGDRVVGVGGVAGNIDDDAEVALLAGGGDGFRRDERGDLGGQVNAVDKDVNCGQQMRISKGVPRACGCRERKTYHRESRQRGHPWQSLACPT